MLLHGTRLTQALGFLQPKALSFSYSVVLHDAGRGRPGLGILASSSDMLVFTATINPPCGSKHPQGQCPFHDSHVLAARRHPRVKEQFMDTQGAPSPLSLGEALGPAMGRRPPTYMAKKHFQSCGPGSSLPKEGPRRTTCPALCPLPQAHSCKRTLLIITSSEAMNHVRPRMCFGEGEKEGRLSCSL